MKQADDLDGMAIASIVIGCGYPMDLLAKVRNRTMFVPHQLTGWLGETVRDQIRENIHEADQQVPGADSIFRE